MRIRVPIDQIELANADLKRIENQLAQNMTLLNKAWSTILLESLVKVRINNTFLQSNLLANRIQSSDAEMSNYLKLVVSSFIEADNRAGKFVEKLSDNLYSTAGGGKVGLKDLLFDSRKIYIALALLGPVALVLPVVTALNWVKERMSAKGQHQPTPVKVEKKPKREQSQPLQEQTTSGPEPLTTEEREQLARNGMTEDQFRHWQEETGWRPTPENPGGWPAQPERTAVTSFPGTQEVDNFYGIPSVARSNGYGYASNSFPLGSFNEDGTYVPVEGGIYNCAEYVKRFYSQNERHGLFGDRDIQNVTNLMPGRVPIVSYGDGTTEVMTSLNLAGNDIPRPGDVYYASNHWAIVKGVDPQTNEVIIIEQNYNGTFGIQHHQPERRVVLTGGNYFRINN